ncbi:MAG: histone H1 [Bacteroidota bacterium]
MQYFRQLKDCVLEELRTDMMKFYNRGNKTAARRARKLLQQVKALAHNVRMDIQRQRNANN